MNAQTDFYLCSRLKQLVQLDSMFKGIAVVFLVSIFILAIIFFSFKNSGSANVEYRIQEYEMKTKADKDPYGHAIFYAIIALDKEAVSEILSSGEDVDVRGYGQRTPVSVSASVGAFDIMLLLLEAGADPSLADEWGKTAIDYFLNARVTLTNDGQEAHPKVEGLLRERGYLAGDNH